MWAAVSFSTIGKMAQKIELDTICLNATKDPMQLFHLWRNDAKDTPENINPDGMTLSTVKEDGSPASRTVLLRDISDEGFKLYTDYRSPKGRDMARNPHVSLVFVWLFSKGDGRNKGFRQVRVEGVAEKLSVAESQAYFNGEPIMAQIRTVVQNQSTIVTDNRKSILERAQALLDQYEANPSTFKLEMPLTWGGYIVKPATIEFYQGSRDAINDRIKFFPRKDFSGDLPPGVYPGDNGWVYEQLEA